MEKTFLGVIQVEPRQILEEGIRKELVRQICLAMHRGLVFIDLIAAREKATQSKGFFTSKRIIVPPDPSLFIDKLKLLAQRLDAFRRSFEYIQDYIHVYGLRLWLEEFSRVINFHVEQEANLFLKRAISEEESQWQSKTIPIPQIQARNIQEAKRDSGIKTSPYAINFMGRLAQALRILTDWRITIYAPESGGWYASVPKYQLLLFLAAVLYHPTQPPSFSLFFCSQLSFCMPCLVLFFSQLPFFSFLLCGLFASPVSPDLFLLVS